MLEISVDSTASALAAEAGGADRIELCANGIIGGTTPTEALFEHVREKISIPIRVLLRPRFGDFYYDESEFQVLKKEVSHFVKAGADGIVIGMLTPNGELDLPRMQMLIEEAKGTDVILHRAFDVCKDPMQALRQAKELGIKTILTSGQQESAIQGVDLLQRLQEESQGQIEILAGAGVSAEVIPQIYEQTGITSYHMSGKEVLDSAMKFRREGVPMGLPGFSEYDIIRTSRAKVQAARKVIDAL